MATNRVFNFAAGPACLPLEVLKEAQADMLSYKGSGMSVMEMSHRSKEFDGIITTAEADLRKLLSIPDNYKVVFLQGGASTQFASLVYNFTVPGDAVDYVVTGAWSKKAFEEANKLGLKANLVAKGDNKSIPDRDSWKLSPDAKFVHYCDNETIGVRVFWARRGGCAAVVGRAGGIAAASTRCGREHQQQRPGCDRAPTHPAPTYTNTTATDAGRRVPRGPRRRRDPPHRRHVVQLPLQARRRVKVSAARLGRAV
jgi:hypothetical protein